VWSLITAFLVLWITDDDDDDDDDVLMFVRLIQFGGWWSFTPNGLWRTWWCICGRKDASKWKGSRMSVKVAVKEPLSWVMTWASEIFFQRFGLRSRIYLWFHSLEVSPSFPSFFSPLFLSSPENKSVPYVIRMLTQDSCL
jgi:hypothetical protein